MDVTAILKRWWPVPGFFAAAIAVQLVAFGGRSARGHAAGHLGSASVVFPLAALLAVIIWAAPRAFRRPELWLAAAVLITGAVMVTVGNLRVVDSIGANNWTDAQADALGSARPGFDSGHDLAGRGMSVAVAGAVLLALLLLARGHVSRRAGLGSAALSLLFPPWIFPGPGVIVLAVALCLSSRRSSTTASSRPRRSGAPSPRSKLPMPGS
jgi:hypothetical protein